MSQTKISVSIVIATTELLAGTDSTLSGDAALTLEFPFDQKEAADVARDMLASKLNSVVDVALLKLDSQRTARLAEIDRAALAELEAASKVSPPPPDEQPATLP